jgi:pimeloyl-ACP methyl ester carboxylesterase
MNEKLNCVAATMGVLRRSCGKAALAGVLIALCQNIAPSAAAEPLVKRANVDGITLPYIDHGQGVPVVFVHGEFSDLRAWERQRESVAGRYRFVSYTQRYFGSGDWPDAGESYSFATHVADLEGFVRQLKAGPVYLVGISYGAAVAIGVALSNPELVRGVWAHEPAIGQALATGEARSSLEQEQKGLAGATYAAEAGKVDAAVRLYSDWTNRRIGGFHELAVNRREMHMANSRTAPLHLSARSTPAISCADLGRLQPPLVLGTGDATRPYFRLLAETAQRCVPGSQLVVLPRARHDAPNEKPALFTEELMRFLGTHDRAASAGCAQPASSRQRAGS